MQIIRWILGRLILLFNALFSPRSPKRTPEVQTALDSATSRYSLYQYDACPFCVKVRRALKRNGLNIELRDAKQPEHQQALQAGGGQLKVPCLHYVENGQDKWMYESSDIIAYLEQRYITKEAAAA